MYNTIFKMNTIIKGNNIYLRQLRRSDLKTIYSIFSNEKNTEFELFKPFDSLDDAKAYMKMVHYRFLDKMGNYRIYAIVANNNKMVGIIEATHNDENNTWELGYVLNYESRHNGYMTEAIKLIMIDIVQCKGAKSFIVETDKQNKENIEMLGNIGFKFINQYKDIRDYKGNVRCSVTFALNI